MSRNTKGRIRVDGVLYEAVDIPGVVGDVPKKIGSRWGVHTETGDAVTVYSRDYDEYYEIEFFPKGGKISVTPFWGSYGILTVDVPMQNDLISYIEDVVYWAGDAVEDFIDRAKDVVYGAASSDVVMSVLYPDDPPDFEDEVKDLADKLKSKLESVL